MIKITKTMIDKSIIDANAQVRDEAKKFGFDYDTAKPGDRFVVQAKWPDGEESEVRFYRAHNKRGDKRISIKGLRQHAKPGDIVWLKKARKIAQLGVIDADNAA